MTEQGGGGSGDQGEKKKILPGNNWKLPDTEDEPPRADEPCEYVLELTPQRHELSKSWQRAIDRSAAGEGSDYLSLPVDVNRQAAHHHVQNQPGSSSSTAIVIDSDDEDDNILRMEAEDPAPPDAQPPAQPKN